ncbi:hypothetical protein [uncultured Paludibaculum sp.]|uniref:hypothetical protein n=1 Tax=uncultured Paludibaculum sp. TaxID=1765020 RepID=UPI002AAB94AC|nr:hypothetical protein [uncultured Paludibaculum sp.]
MSAVLIEPCYVGETLVLPQGTTVRGRITSVDALPFGKRTRRLLSGDLTPPKSAQVTFDQFVLADGSVVPISTVSAVAVKGVRTATYAPNKPRPGVRQVLAGAVRPLTEPKKLQRLGRAAVKTLPYHPEFLERGVVFDTALLTELKTSIPVQPTNTERSAGTGLVHVRLLTPLNSSTASDNTAVQAVVLRPYYTADGTLRLPAGATLDGRVSNAAPSGKWRKHGTLGFEFRSASVPGTEAAPLSARVAGIEAMHPQSLSIDGEGDITAKNSVVGRILAVTSLVGPVTSSADPSLNKTVFSRAGQGRSFGLIGAGAAQASSSTATGFGFFGAAMKIYDAFLAHGAEIELPKNTPVLLRLSE